MNEAQKERRGPPAGGIDNRRHVHSGRGLALAGGTLSGPEFRHRSGARHGPTEAPRCFLLERGGFSAAGPHATLARRKRDREAAAAVLQGKPDGGLEQDTHPPSKAQALRGGDRWTIAGKLHRRDPPTMTGDTHAGVTIDRIHPVNG